MNEPALQRLMAAEEVESPAPARDFRKVLVANRGEIARRVFRTLREMGLATVAVFSDADRDAAHVAEGDEAVRLEAFRGDGARGEVYLDSEAVIAAARAVGAEAIHPGYGFLAENADFAERCAAAGLVFIGPSPRAIRTMGDKARAKALAAEVGVPGVEGFELAGLDAGEIVRRVEELGFPVLIKAVAGGGGKGMRAVARADQLDQALAAAAREAEGAFGDGALLIERLVESPRHVEVQVFGDAEGRVVHCFERDCSVQRRHQKVFEEAPSPAVDGTLRRRLGEAAVALARAVDYQGAGTVEFLLDARGAFYFLEMNTRLQVEHPVTEAATGLDLVRLQVDVARGLPLPFEQDELELSGHAIEARLYAEDPANDFLPVSGKLALWSAPSGEVPGFPGLRVDSGVEEGDTIGVRYDPLLAKVIAHGRTRDEALQRLHRGLSELAAGGLTTNRELLLAVLEHEAFVRGEVDTGFLDRLAPRARARPFDPQAAEQHAVVAVLYLWERRRHAPGPVPAGVPSGWRNNRWRPQEEIFEGPGPDGERVHYAVSYVVDARERLSIDVTVTSAGGEILRETRGLDVELVASPAGELVAEIGGVRRRFRIACSGGSARLLSVHGLGRLSDLTRVPRFPERRAPAVAGGCAAPMTGKVVEVLVAEGDRVSAGAPLVVLEAMKMEHRLEARNDGVVEAVHVEAGQMVDPDDVLVVVAGDEEARDG